MLGSIMSTRNNPAEGGRRPYNPRGGRPPLDVDFMAVCDAVREALDGNGETITAIALRFRVSRGWLHTHVFPVTKGDGTHIGGDRS